MRSYAIFAIVVGSRFDTQPVHCSPESPYHIKWMKIQNTSHCQSGLVYGVSTIDASRTGNMNIDCVS